MKNRIEHLQSKKFKKWILITILLGEFLFFTAIWWGMLFFLFKMPWVWTFISYLVILLFMGTTFYLVRKASLKRLQKEKENAAGTISHEFSDSEIDKAISKPLRWAQIIRIFLTPFLFAMCMILVYVDYFSQEIIPVIILDRTTINIMSLVVAIFVILSVISVFRIKRYQIKAYKNNLIFKKAYKLGMLIFGMDFLTWASINAIAIYGLLLAFFGAGWQITTPFFVVSALAQVFIIPTRKKWRKIADEIANNSSPSI